jgi:hypothetical protein
MCDCVWDLEGHENIRDIVYFLEADSPAKKNTVFTRTNNSQCYKTPFLVSVDVPCITSPDPYNLIMEEQNE